jgi:hypothetical protein
VSAADELVRLERIFRERGYSAAMVSRARELTAELGIDPPGWAAPARAPERESTGAEWHRQRRDDQLRREWEQWRYQRSKLPPERRGRMMELGQRSCKRCDLFFEPATLRQRYCCDTCRKLAHKERRA